MNTTRKAWAPKQWSLTKHETITSFEAWRQNLQYTLSLDRNFASFLADGVTWLKKSPGSPVRGFQDDAESVPQSKVKQRYGTELRSKSLASLKPEISQALDSLLKEIHTTTDAKILRSTASKLRLPSVRSCPLCKQAGRNGRHFLSKCIYLPAEGHAFLAKARLTCSFDEEVDLRRRSCCLHPNLPPGSFRVVLAPNNLLISTPSINTTGLSSPWTLASKLLLVALMLQLSKHPNRPYKWMVLRHLLLVRPTSPCHELPNASHSMSW